MKPVYKSIYNSLNYDIKIKMGKADIDFEKELWDAANELTFIFSELIPARFADA